MLAEALLWDLGNFAEEQKVYRGMKCERVQTDCQAAVGKEGEGREQRRREEQGTVGLLLENH